METDSSNLSQGSAPLLVMELAYPTHRGKLTTMYNTLWYVGSIVAAWTVYGTVKYTSDAAWRIPVGVQAAMPAIQLIGIWFLPESPRWLCAKDRASEAFEVLAKYHANGDTHSAFIEQELFEIQETIRLEQQNSHGSWADLVRTPGNRKRLLLIILTAFFSQCSGNGLVSYYIHDILTSVGVHDASDQSIINGGLQIWSFLVAVLFSVLLVDRLGRRTLFLTAGVGMLIAFSIWTACSAVYADTGNKAAGGAVIAMIFAFYGVAGFAWPGLTVSYCAEILPFHIRAKGLAVTMAGTAASSVFNQYVNPIGLAALHWKFYFVYIAILVLECGAIYFLYVETRGPTLEEIARLFDGEDADVAGKEEVVDVARGKIAKGNSAVGAEHVEEA
ncbi:putative hexose transporter protein [Lasiodiplodia theobromae]|nr:putative hexose transporter protein [Lasiodiplodia theobromae]